MTPDRMAALHGEGFAGGQVWSKSDIAAMLSNPLIEAMTLGDDGFALLQLLPPEAELLTIVIAKAAQGQGRGAALMAETMARAFRAGCTRMFLEVGADNIAARALYENAGFAETGRRKGYYRRAEGKRADAILLSRQLFAEYPAISAKG